MHKFSIQLIISMEQMICTTCGALFALPSILIEAKRKEGGNFHCPNGHPLIFTETEIDRLRKQRNQLGEQTDELEKDLRKARREIKKLSKPKKRKKPK